MGIDLANHDARRGLVKAIVGHPLGQLSQCPLAQGKAPAEQVTKYIRRATRKQYSAEEKIRIVLEGR